MGAFCMQLHTCRSKLQNLGISSEIATAKFTGTRESRIGIVCWVGSWTKLQTKGGFPKPTPKKTPR